jgi:tRNA threonylcarbamoyl adenosine modification protein (Sua5/YciO/YrdC/YwlC family)
MKIIPLADANVSDTAAALTAGRTIVYPTETCYGLGCDATNAAAVERLFVLKGRPKEKSFILLAPSLEAMAPYIDITPALRAIAARYWQSSPPQALTVVVPAKRGVSLPQGVIAADGTIAFRVSAHPFARALAAALGRPIVSTSANKNGEQNPYAVANAVDADIAIDAGILPTEPPTTLVRLEGGGARILRQGRVQFFLPAASAVSVRRAYVILLAAGLLGAGIIFGAYRSTMSLMMASVPVLSDPGSAPEVLAKKLQMRPRYQTVKGLYLTAYSAGNPRKVDEIDIKDYSGKVLYDSNVPLANELGLTEDVLGDVRALVRTLHNAHIYVIARQTIFQDPMLAEQKPEWAIRSTAGGLWRDRKGLAWVDPTNEDVWRYNLAIAKEAARFGFDEINFDYVRFPSDGNMRTVVYTNGTEDRTGVMRRFYEFFGKEFAFEPVRISLDFFGFVMERHDGLSIGQRLEDAADSVDYISPMMYPSHYPAGHLGFANPADHPGAVVDNGMKAGTPYLAGKRAKVRPWIQAFNLGAVYDAAKIREQISAVERYSDAGWLLWNAANRYTDAGLNPQAYALSR